MGGGGPKVKLWCWVVRGGGGGLDVNLLNIAGVYKLY